MKIKKSIRMTDEVSMASTSDIAFLLIIFFMVTSAFSMKEGLHLVLPSKDKKPEVVMDRKIAHITVNRDGKYLFDGKKASREDIESRVKSLLEEDEETIVLVKVNKEALYQNAVDIIDAVKNTGAKKLSLRMLDE